MKRTDQTDQRALGKAPKVLSLKMNEKKIEIIVRNHFYPFLDIIEIEEQKSDNPKIDKLLKTASKKGNQQGYPDFIITYKTNSNSPSLQILSQKNLKDENWNRF